MSTTLPIDRRIGISTLCLGKTPLFEAVRLVYDSGFHAFELVPHLYGGPESLGPDLRVRLKQALGCFDVVTVHSSTVRLNTGEPVDVASEDASFRARSVAQYQDLVDLALDIGAKLATLHAGYGTSDEGTAQQREAHLACAEGLCAMAGDSSLLMGYEYFDAPLAELIDLPTSGFGVLFDIGHAAMRSQGDLTAGVLALQRELSPFVVQYHVHGVHVGDDGRRQDHRSFKDNNGIDYGQVVLAIKRDAFQGPLILEIEAWSDRDVQLTLEHSVSAREELVALWEGV